MCIARSFRMVKFGCKCRPGKLKSSAAGEAAPAPGGDLRCAGWRPRTRRRPPAWPRPPHRSRRPRWRHFACRCAGAPGRRIAASLHLCIAAYLHRCITASLHRCVAAPQRHRTCRQSLWQRRCPRCAATVVKFLPHPHHCRNVASSTDSDPHRVPAWRLRV